MLEKKLSWSLTVATLVVASQGCTQQENPQDEAAVEQELAREQAAAESERAAVERELALEQAAVERELAAGQAAFEREHAEAEREFAREQAAAERELATVQREFARQLSRTKALSAAESANLQRELSKAREELARTVADVAHLSAQVRTPALQAFQRNMRFIAGGRSVLGLNIEDTDLGVLVSGVTPNGPAATAGVAVGDTIVSINDVELAQAASDGSGRSPSAALLGQVGNVVPGDEVKLRILRDGDYRDVVVKAGENRLRMPYVVGANDGSWLTTAWAPFRYSGAWSDIELVSLTPALGEYFGVNEGLLVVRAGRAAELGFRDGDVIIDLAGRKPQSPEHALRILASFEPGESLQAAIMRQRRREALAIRVPTAPTE